MNGQKKNYKPRRIISILTIELDGKIGSYIELYKQDKEARHIWTLFKKSLDCA